MVAINKAEKEAVIERFPNAHIIRTMKHRSKRHHYYVEENRSIIRFLNQLRGIPNQPGKGGGRYR